MFQLMLPMAISIYTSLNDMSCYVNTIVEIISDNKTNEFKHHRGTMSYHSK